MAMMQADEMSLLQILDGRCDLHHVQRVTDYLLFDPPVIKRSLDVVMAAIIPYPCLRVKDTFWDTRAGRYLNWAIWTCYKGEAITQASAAKLIFGSSSSNALTKLWRLTHAQGKLTLYAFPELDYPPREKWYLRLSDVESYKKGLVGE